MTPSAMRRAAVLVATCSTLGAAPQQIRLWPGDAPGETGTALKEHDATKPTDGLMAGRPVTKIVDVSVPTISVYRPSADLANGTAVLVCPGGGYNILAWDIEGTEVCNWLNSVGVTAVLLKYRVPRREGQTPYHVALQDAQRAMGMTRSHAAEWGINPARLGVIGFSAGGNLCAVLSASTSRTYPRVDEADDKSFHPSFQLLIYPAYLVTKDDMNVVFPSVVPEAAVTTATPPTFLVMAEDDPIRVENVLEYGMALKQAMVPMELHVYPTGGHGYGLRPTDNYVTSWPARAADWMRSRDLIPKAEDATR